MRILDKLPADWNFVPLGEIGSFINGDRGRNYPGQEDFVENGVPFINAGHLRDGNIDFESMNYISEEKFNLLGSGKVKPNDILYCLRGSLGKTAIVPNISKGAVASSLVIIRPSERVRTDYLFYFLTSPFGQSEIYKYDNGSSQPNLSAKSVKEYQIPLPPIAEQKRIAAILDKAESLRSLRRQAIAQLDTLTQSLFLEMFGDLRTNPKQWVTEGIENVCELIVDCVNRTAPIVDYTTPFKMIRTSNVKSGKVLLDDVRYVTADTFERWNRRAIPSYGDVLPG